ncbi:DUF5106 domain-containing protein [Alistipes communis]|uniref:DUF5106 domain-containing protein n=1 Tax=Alistipes communis TaxID=2585118 RepID=UPI003AF577AC
MKRILWIALAALLVAACGGKKSRPAQSSARPAPRTFRAVAVPSTVPPEERRAYLRDHYWDNFDFRDTTLLAEVDTVAMVRALFAYVANFVAPDDRAAIDTLMRRASASKPMTEYFAMLAERVLHDPNSPARNDELYIPVLEALVSSPWLDRWERIAPQHDLRMASQNRIGRPANDFRYTTADGVTRRMYDIRAEYLLLFINNPGCNMCKTVREAISASPMLNELIERGKLKVLALFPDEDLTEWQEYRPQIPARWINAYDKGCVVRDRELYDLKAIPALYLLDRDKRVMVKDAVDVGLIEWAIDHDDRKN